MKNRTFLKALHVQYLSLKICLVLKIYVLVTAICIFVSCRWTVRASAILGILLNYGTLLTLFDECLGERPIDPELRSRLIGTKTQMLDQQIFFGEILDIMMLNQTIHVTS